MKTYITLFIMASAITRVFAQGNWFQERVKIGQSMENSYTESQPAQLQFTDPKRDTSSWLINFGTAITLGDPSRPQTSWLSKIVGEYHRNTLFDKKQHNQSIGYGYTWMFADGISAKNFGFVSTGDLKYVFDDVKEDHSIASHILFTLYRDEGNVRFNAERYNGNNTVSFYFAPVIGVQFQDIFDAKENVSKSVYVRPMFSVLSYLSFNRSYLPHAPRVRASVSYTGRQDMVNTSDLDNEGYTELLKTGVDYFIISKPVKLSLGVSFNKGSDPLKGLASQEYWLFTLNLSK